MLKIFLYSIIFFSLLATLIFIYLQKKNEEEDIKKNSVYTSALITAITPTFKGSVKIDYQYNFHNQPYTGFTLANEHTGYKTGEHFYVMLHQNKPNKSILKPIHCNSKSVPQEGWLSIPTN